MKGRPAAGACFTAGKRRRKVLQGRAKAYDRCLAVLVMMPTQLGMMNEPGDEPGDVRTM